MTDPAEKLVPMPHAASNLCFGCGAASLNGLRLEFLLASDGSVVSHSSIPEIFEGHPGYLHGGIIATLLDEGMSKAVRARGITSMTRQMEIEFLRPVPSCTPLRIEGRVVRNQERKHWTEAKILNGQGTTLAESKGLFIELRSKPEK